MTTQSAGVDMKILNHLYITGRNVKWYSNPGTHFGSFLWTKCSTAIHSTKCTPWYLSFQNESLCSHTHTHTKPCPWMVIAALFVIANTGVGTNALRRWMVKQTMVYTYHGILLTNKKQWTIDTHNILDTSLRNYTAWKKKSQKGWWFYLYNIFEMMQFWKWRTD